jgi:hypothetical protein
MTYYSTDGSGIRLFVPYYSTGTKDWAMYFRSHVLPRCTFHNVRVHLSRGCI